MLNKFKSLQVKVLIISACFFGLFSMINLLVEYYIVYPSFISLEQDEAQKNLSRVVDNIQNSISNLGNTCHDWAAWDDSYNFMQTGSDRFRSTNLVKSTFENNKIHFLCLFDTKGEIVWGEAYNEEFEEPMNPAKLDPKGFPPSHPFFSYTTHKKPLNQMDVTGIWITAFGPMLIVSQPILTSQNEGPIAGTLVMGRFLGKKLVKDLASQAHVQFEIRRYDPDAVPAAARHYGKNIQDDASIRIHRQDEAYLSAYTVISDIHGQKALVIKADTPRDISAKGRTAIRYAVVSNFFGIIGIFLVFVLLIQQTVLKPITLLKNYILNIGASGDPVPKLSLNLNDEIGTLGMEFDKLLVQLDGKASELSRLNHQLTRDIEKRKAAEEELSRARAFLFAAFEQSPAGMVIADAPDVSIRMVNSAALTIRGDSTEDMVNISSDLDPGRWQLLQPDGKRYPPEELPLTRAIKRGEITRNQEMIMHHETGKNRWLLANAAPIRGSEGEIAAGICVFLDITEFKHAQEALHASEERFRSYVENASDIIYTMNAEGVYTYITPNVETLFGYKNTELIGKNFKNIWHPDDIEKRAVYLEKVLKGEKADPPSHRAIDKEGNCIWFTSNISTFKNKDGELEFLGIARNINEQQLFIREKEALQERLARSQKMEALGLLAGGVAHDLNNVLSGIASYPELLLLDLPKKSPLRKPLLTIQRSGQKAAEIVQDLLTLARRGVMNIQVLNLNTIISEYLNSPEYEKLLTYHPGTTLNVSLAYDLLNIHGSPIHLRKTIMNLVSNAAEAQPSGGHISITTLNQYLDRPIKGYDTIAAGDYVVVRVSDRGIGIHPEDIGRIFEPFYTKKVMGRSGTGLGMAVVWGTVQDHNGYIDIESAQGKGTTFSLFFPVTQETIFSSTDSFRLEDFKGAGETILVVDDMEEQRLIASGILTKAGYQVTTVSSGEEAIRYLSETAVDLVVLDMIMDPGMDGLSTYQEILKTHPGQRAIIASGFSETDRVKETLRLGANAYIRKPYTLEKILRATTTALKP